MPELSETADRVEKYLQGRGDSLSHHSLLPGS